MTNLIYKLDKSAEDVEALLAEHKKLIYYMLTSMKQLNNPDAESAAWEALWDAIGTFDVYSKTAFSTYACTLIRNAVNDVLRKQRIEHDAKLTAYRLLERDATSYSMEYSTELTAFVDQCVTAFINSKSGISRNVLLAWYSSGFSATVTNIAAMCSCSASYVSRVQQDFRAYLSGRLKHF
jgi:RNA polymerase sigma factor (sigma-70 family)